MEHCTGPLTLKPGLNCHLFAFIGSRVIPHAASKESDLDIAVYCKPAQANAFDMEMKSRKADRGGGNEYGGTDGDGMTSYKLVGDHGLVFNYLMFEDVDYFWRFVDATTICRHLGVTDKPTRVEIFRLLTDGIRDCEILDPVEVHEPQLEDLF